MEVESCELVMRVVGCGSGGDGSQNGEKLKKGPTTKQVMGPKLEKSSKKGQRPSR